MKVQQSRKRERSRSEITQSLVLIGLIVVLCIVATDRQPALSQSQQIINIFSQIAVLGIVASGIGMLLISGEIDISAGNQVSLMGVILAMIIRRSAASPPALQGPGSRPLPSRWRSSRPSSSAASYGGLNGFTVIKSRAASFIITLGFSSVYRGLALLITGGASYMLFGKFELLGRGRILRRRSPSQSSFFWERSCWPSSS